MKLNLSLFILGLFAYNLSWSQSSNIDSYRQNYVRKSYFHNSNYKVEHSSNNNLPDLYAKRNVTYLDGIGNAILSINPTANVNFADIVKPFVNNPNSNIQREYLAYISQNSGNGIYKTNTNAINELTNFYKSNSNSIDTTDFPFAETRYENNRLGRVLEVGSQGRSWQLGKRSVKYAYRYNTAADAVRLFNASGSSTSNYLANKLTVVELTDENNNKILNFYDFNGRHILKKIQASTTEWLNTYHIYDDMGRLLYTISPEGEKNLTGTSVSISTGNFIDLWCSEYKYDLLGRLIEQKSPGGQLTMYVYDQLDRPVLVQDPNRRAAGEWYFTKYDERGRVVYEGIYKSSSTRQVLQTNADNVNAKIFETRSSSVTYQYYTNAAFPVLGANDLVLGAQYYDNYDFDNNGTVDYAYVNQSLPQEGTPQAYNRGNLTIKRTRIIGTNNWLIEVYFYDKYDRLIQLRSNNQLFLTVAGATTFVYNFIGQLTHKKVSVKPNSTTTHFYDETYEYYITNGALKHVYHSVMGKPQELVAYYKYNSLGQLIERNLGYTPVGLPCLDGQGCDSSDSSSFYLQSIDYRYNIRGWLRQINTSQLTSSPNERTDVFGMELFYNTNASLNTANAAYFNGNISAVKWKVAHTGENVNANPQRERSYRYEYDKVDRLTAANYMARASSWNQESGAYTVNNISYDRNGNVKTMNRNYKDTEASSVVTADQLTYNYTGNRLLTVNDASSATTAYGFQKGPNASAQYQYDANGNMNVDPHKGTQLSYNLINKTEKVDKGSGNYLLYTYSASGQRIKSQTYSNNTLVSTTDYLQGMEYDNGQLKRMAMPEGRVDMTNINTPEYQYVISDNQGNSRVMFRKVSSSLFATMETSLREQEEENFDNVAQTAHTDRIHARTGNNAAWLSKEQQRLIGPERTMTVRKGDHIKAEVYGHYIKPPKETVWSVLSNFALIVQAAPTPQLPKEASRGRAIDNISVGVQYLPGSPPVDKRVPKAYIKYIFYDSAGHVVKHGEQAISQAAADSHELLELEEVAPEDGYARIYVANESNTDVWFDDLMISHASIEIIQENHYDPWGLPLQGIAISTTPPDNNKNRYLYNGPGEYQEASFAAYHSTPMREYDPALGRFHAVDPMVHKYSSWTPYNYAFNKPTLLNDPSGADPIPGYSDYVANWLAGRVQIHSIGGIGEGGYVPHMDGRGGGGIGPGSGNHWSNQYKTPFENFMFMSTPNFQRYYGVDLSTDEGKAWAAKAMGGSVNYAFANDGVSDDQYYEKGAKNTAWFINGLLVGVSARGAAYFYADFSEFGNRKFSLEFKGQSGGMTFFSNSNHALNIGAGIYGAMAGLTSNQGYWLGENGKYYSTDWGGNQHTGSRAGAFNAANTYKLAGKAVVVGQVALGVYSTRQGYIADGGQFGYNAQRAAASSAVGIGFGLAGAQAGAAAGAAFGSLFGGVGAIPGAVIGGVIGGFGLGIGGSYFGSYLGESAVDYFHRR